jgi:SAM-dependent methyltransferase
MTRSDDLAPDMAALKDRLKASWMAGDYGLFATYLEGGALEFMERIDIAEGTTVLDVACGAGQVAIPAARAGARVTGVDIATNSLAQARERAEVAGLEVDFDEGDAERLPYDDASFDLVISLFGAMFAPRPERVAAELLRVCRPGGRIVMGNWTPEGFNGHMFRTIGKYAPPPTMPSPLLWGHEPTIRERLSDGVADLRVTKRQYPFQYPFAPAGVVEFFRGHYGPLVRAFAALDETGRDGLRDDLERLWSEHNRSEEGTVIASEYVEVVAVRA